jgi:hypothetical protein
MDVPKILAELHAETEEIEEVVLQKTAEWRNPA